MDTLPCQDGFDMSSRSGSDDDQAGRQAAGIDWDSSPPVESPPPQILRGRGVHRRRMGSAGELQSWQPSKRDRAFWSLNVNDGSRAKQLREQGRSVGSLGLTLHRDRRNNSSAGQPQPPSSIGGGSRLSAPLTMRPASHSRPCAVPHQTHHDTRSHLATQRIVLHGGSVAHQRRRAVGACCDEFDERPPVLETHRVNDPRIA